MKTAEKLSQSIVDKISIDFLRNQVLKNAYGNNDTVIAAMDPRILIIWYLFFAIAPWLADNLVFLLGCFILVMVTTIMAHVAPLVLFLFTIGVFAQTGYLLVVSLFFGGNVYDAAKALADMGADAVGINCSTGPDQLMAVTENLRKAVDIPLIVKPNAGMPVIDDQGNPVYSMKAREFALNMKRLISAGVDIAGGCCGTTPEYIRELKGIL